MKKRTGFILLLVLTMCLSGCGSSKTDASVTEAPDSGNFAPEATAVTQSGLTQAVAAQSAAAPTADNSNQGAAEDGVATDAVATDAVAADVAATDAAAVDAPVATVDVNATQTPAPGTTINGYSVISETGLGFNYSYPNGWDNNPGRSTVCYRQPTREDGGYRARVAVTMRKLAHDCKNEAAAVDLLKTYLENIRTQYDEKTFEVGDLDSTTQFMGQKAWSDTYLAYDGNTEIKGYVILTYYTRYVFVYHFMCSYEDYPAYESAMKYMRDSVQPEQF